MKLGKIFLVLVLIVVPISIGVLAYKQVQKTGELFQQLAGESVLNLVLNSSTATGTTSQSGLAHLAAGFEAPQTYLVLLLNNTEMRPGGGFIGAYGVVRISGGVPEILQLEGTELLDGRSGGLGLSAPPVPLASHIKNLKKWYFRDSNWSPDFALSSQNSLEIYKKENGQYASEITGVIGITPTVFENVISIVGPVTVDGMEFNEKNFTEKLEYEVEYGFAHRGEQFNERKNLLPKMASALMVKVSAGVFENWAKYYDLYKQMVAQKQLLAYFVDPEMQSAARQMGFAGEMKKFGGDYLLWADANLGALKTDLAIQRELTYSWEKTVAGTKARASMKYRHAGKFDWRTSRYLTYARIFVPEGSKLVGVSEIVNGKKSVAKEIESGVENGRQWFGAFMSIEPGTTEDLVFEYWLPEKITRQITAGDYSFLAQKQLGLNNVKLTVNWDFGKNIETAQPAETGKVLNDSKYLYQTDLNVDRDFVVKLGK